MAGVWRCVSVDRSHIRHQGNDSDTGDQGMDGQLLLLPLWLPLPELKDNLRITDLSSIQVWSQPQFPLLNFHFILYYLATAGDK